MGKAEVDRHQHRDIGAGSKGRIYPRSCRQLAQGHELEVLLPADMVLTIFLMRKTSLLREAYIMSDTAV
jgi:hypothetical protein